MPGFKSYPPQFTGFGGYGPWPTNDEPTQDAPVSPHYDDGYANRAPGCSHIEGPADYWLDTTLYPDRPNGMYASDIDRLEQRSRAFRISAGNITGRKPGPSED